MRHCGWVACPEGKSFMGACADRSQRFLAAGRFRDAADFLGAFLAAAPALLADAALFFVATAAFLAAGLPPIAFPPAAASGCATDGILSWAASCSAELAICW